MIYHAPPPLHVLHALATVRRLAAAALLLTATLPLLTGCGQTGALYLPQDAAPPAPASSAP